MKKKIIIFSLLIIGYAAQSQQQTSRILFVFDDSFSMFGKWQSGMKIDIAKKLLSSFLDSLKNTPNLELAMRCFGHEYPLEPKRNCEDTKLVVPFETAGNSVPKMKAFLKNLSPLGTTPIAHTLGKCADDFPPKPNCRNIIILITDGIEECGGDPCSVSMELQKKGIILKPFIIGIGLTAAFADVMGCIGKYYDASTEEGFKNILNVVVSQALNNTTVQVNLLDKGGKPTETDVNMTFYDQYSGAIKYNFLHTINHKGNPDTVTIDPLGTYKLVVHTIPPVQKENITVTPGKHNIIAVDAPQGYMFLKVSGGGAARNLPCIIRKKGEMKTLNVQYFNEKEKYIIGYYDLEILTLPRIYLNEINIAQSSTTNIEIPEAGTVSIQKPSPGPGSLYLEENNKLVWVCNLDETLYQESFVLQPGKYRVEYRPQNSKESIYTIEKRFTIVSGQSVQVKMY
jgi:Ca-activated chloride channel family protein